MNSLLEIIEQRGITRLCHFTKLNKVLHILAEADGIKSNIFIEEGIIQKNDKNRFDGHEDYISTSVQYPNIWYLNRVKDLDPLFRKWVILCIDPSIILDKRTLFCETNAATRNGRLLKEGVEGFENMFKEIINVKRYLKRTSKMLKCSPTDDQAEVMIYGSIPRDRITGIIVPSEKDVINLTKAMELAYINIEIPIIVAPDIFTTKFSSEIREGITPDEKLIKK
ncbi:DarT ssDNA thymidine ADP-ribosyltransferase family protein [Romboutsia sp.]|uniref:DarT ssDNA thymidine ADP-ribosyltransferase family protein n=1 Tax=Romboutsia sp. TaxID=1965302 RepID=UPI002BD94346|nr:DarT ssDNA thymidine ADP-ribosyltransferase family protein [Romboutsia sp.]HSQ88386.1 DarT ssDNA thymidine ADP-ribosyltransferase family protein [Romboutsia sp.]